MSVLANLVDAGAAVVNAGPVNISGAVACLERFTEAFNARDLCAMDAELHFPHSLLSGAQEQVWNEPGSHPPGLFQSLRESGWRFTQYELIQPLHAIEGKVHFLVVYTRRGEGGVVISEHRNVWVAVQRVGRWGIVWRSY